LKHVPKNSSAHVSKLFDLIDTDLNRRHVEHRCSGMQYINGKLLTSSMHMLSFMLFQPQLLIVTGCLTQRVNMPYKGVPGESPSYPGLLPHEMWPRAVILHGESTHAKHCGRFIYIWMGGPKTSYWPGNRRSSLTFVHPYCKSSYTSLTLMFIILAFNSNDQPLLRHIRPSWRSSRCI